MNKFNSTFFTVLILVLLALAACAPASQGRKLTVAINAEYPPFEQVNKATGQVEGFTVDMMNAIAAKAGLDIEYVNMSYDRVLAGVASCQYDIGCSSISITEERKAVMLFSDPIHSGGQVIMVRRDNTGINGKDDLAGKTVAAQKASTSLAEAAKIPDVKLKAFEAMTEVFQALETGQCDAIITDNEVSAYYVAKNPDKAKIVGQQLTSEVDGIAVCKKNAHLLPGINAALKELKADGTLDKLRAKWVTVK